MKQSITTIDLLRHGEVEGDEVYRGITDDSLTDSGWQQMVTALENKKDWDLIITSPLQSCSEFAELIASEEDIDLELNKKLKEIDFGDWDGYSPKDILQESPELLHAWCESPTKITPPGGENYLDFKARVLQSFHNIVQENLGQKVLIITHSGVIRLILMDILGMHDEKLFSLKVDYGSFSKLEIHTNDNGQWGSLVEHK